MDNTYIINLAARYAAAFGAIYAGKMMDKIMVSELKQADENRYKVDVYPETDHAAHEDVSMSFGEKTLYFNAFLMGDESNVFAPPLMMDFSREKNLIVTEVSGGDSEVIERWGTKPWEINIKGLLIDVSGRTYPSEKIEELNTLFEHNDVVEVVGQQFYEKGIYSIYLKSIQITPLEGFEDTVQFTIMASSINPVGWTLLKPTGTIVVGEMTGEFDR